MNIPLVDLKAQYAAIQPDIDAAIARVLGHTGFIGGQEVRAFEEAFAAYQGTRYAVGLASGTAAIHLVLQALGIGPGDEVITTPHTFIATVEPIVTLGARPVFVDIDPRTYNIDPARIEAAITPATKVIMPVHLLGQIAPMDAILEIARRHNLIVVEDAAQAHGAEYQGKRAGAWGVAACFSFYPGKNLGAYGDAGAVCTNDAALAARIAKLRDHGRVDKYAHDEIGYGERLDSLQAAILGAKLPHLEAWTEARRRCAARYDEAIGAIPCLAAPAVLPDSRHVYHVYCIRLKDNKPGRRDAVRGMLNEQGIGVGIHYPIPLHLQDALGRYGQGPGSYPEAEAAAESILSLPIYPELSETQQEQVIMALRGALAATMG